MLSPFLERCTHFVVRLGVWQSTLALSLLVSLLSLTFTWLYVHMLGYEEMGEAFFISLLVPLPMTLLSGWLIFTLLAALEHARQQAHALSMTDPLTGLHNRRYFMQTAQRELGLAQRHQLPFAVLMLDIDHFKQVNDMHGHDVGDQVLITVTQCCHQVLRTTDVLARWGGEEFVVLLPNTSNNHALQLAERMRAAVAASAHIQPPATGVQVTISVGTAGLSPDQTTTLDTLLRQADTALFAAKRGGRNQVQPSPVPSQADPCEHAPSHLHIALKPTTSRY